MATQKKSPKGQISETSEVSDTRPLAFSDQSNIPENLRSAIVQIFHAEVKAMLEGQIIAKLQTETAPVLSPEKKIKTEKGRKKAPVKRPKIAGTVDAVLYEEFEKWRKEHGLTLSHALDTALWHFLGKPPLSFEKEIPKK